MLNYLGLSEERKVRIFAKGKNIEKYQKEKINLIQKFGIKSILDESDNEFNLKVEETIKSNERMHKKCKRHELENDLTSRLMIYETNILRTQSNDVLMQLVNINMIKSTLSLINVSGIKYSRYFEGLKYIQHIMHDYCYFEEKESDIVHKLSIGQTLNKDEKKMLKEIMNQIVIGLITD